MLTVKTVSLPLTDRAQPLCYAASDAHLFFDSGFNFQNQIPVALGAHHVRLCHQCIIRFSQRIEFAWEILHTRLVDSCLLVSHRWLVIEDARLAQKETGKLLQRLYIKLFHLTVDVVVTQHHAEAVQLVFAKLSPRHRVDLLQILLPDVQSLADQTSFFFTVHCAFLPSSVSDFPPMRAQSVWPASAAAVPAPVPPRRSC